MGRCASRLPLTLSTMAPMKAMKAMKASAKAGKAMTKGSLIKHLSEQHELKAKVVSGLLGSLATLATTEVKKNGIFTIPGLCRHRSEIAAWVVHSTWHEHPRDLLAVGILRFG